MNTAKPIRYKSQKGLCMISKPKEFYIVHVDDNGHETVELFGKKAPGKCPYCGKPWEEH